MWFNEAWSWRNQLPYGLLISVSVDPTSIPNQLVLRRVEAVIRLTNRKLARLPDDVFEPLPERYGHRSCRRVDVKHVLV
jgi:hypothetical protein